MTPADLPPSGPLNTFYGELNRPIMRILLWVLLLEVAVIGLAVAVIRFSPSDPNPSTPLPSHIETGKRANASGEGMRQGIQS